MFGAMPGTLACRSPQRCGPSSSPPMTTSVHRSPTTASARERSSSSSGAAMPGRLRAGGMVTCSLQVATEVPMRVAEIAESAGPAVVGLRGGGSGVVVAAGRVLTLASRLRSPEGEVVLRSGATVTGTVLASDQDLDVAVLEADTGDAPVLEW